MYFVNDVTDPDWKIVRQREPRSRRVTAELVGETLSASGSVDAAVMSAFARPMEGEVPTEQVAQPILAALVEQVMAEEELEEDDAPYNEADDVEDMDEAGEPVTSVPANHDPGVNVDPDTLL